MKHTLFTLVACVLTASAAQATVLYTQDFSSASFAFEDPNPIRLGSTTSEVSAGDLFTSQANDGWEIAGGSLNVIQEGGNRFRAAGIWLDTSGWATGQVYVSFDVSSFVAGTAGSEASFEMYSASGVNFGSVGTDYVQVDAQHGSTSLDSRITTSGAASVSSLSSVSIVGDGLLNASFNFTGVEQYVGLFWANNAPDPTSNTQAVFSIDNVSVATVPEPETYTLLLAVFGLVFVLIRNCRR